MQCPVPVEGQTAHNYIHELDLQVHLVYTYDQGWNFNRSEDKGGFTYVITSQALQLLQHLGSLAT